MFFYRFKIVGKKIFYDVKSVWNLHFSAPKYSSVGIEPLIHGLCPRATVRWEAEQLLQKLPAAVPASPVFPRYAPKPVMWAQDLTASGVCHRVFLLPIHTHCVLRKAHFEWCAVKAHWSMHYLIKWYAKKPTSYVDITGPKCHRNIPNSWESSN